MKPIELTVSEQAQTLRWFAKSIGQASIAEGMEPQVSASVQEAMLAGAEALECKRPDRVQPPPGPVEHVSASESVAHRAFVAGWRARSGYREYIMGDEEQLLRDAFAEFVSGNQASSEALGNTSRSAAQEDKSLTSNRGRE